MTARVHRDNFLPIDQVAQLFDKTQLLPSVDFLCRKVQKGLLVKARADMERRNSTVHNRRLFSVYRYKKVMR